ncbi:MAG: ABC transporter ATP-binding protein, partial [Acetobacteraceae bacterium]
MAKVALSGIEKAFGSAVVLRDVSLEIGEGELVSLLGPSGCGKTTLLRILAGFETPDRGMISIDGDEITRLPPARRNMGMVFQAYSLFPNMTAEENVAFGLRVRGRNHVGRRRRAGELLELVGLTQHREKYPRQLSGGQQQRVALARALAVAPQVLLLDEPLSALDAKVRVQLRDEIRRIQQETKVTTIFVTHDQEEA